MQTLKSVSVPCGACGLATRPRTGHAIACDIRFDSSSAVSRWFRIGVQGPARDAHCRPAVAQRERSSVQHGIHHVLQRIFCAQAKKQATGLLVKSEVLQQQLAARDMSLAHATQQMQAVKAEADAAAARHDLKVRRDQASSTAQPALFLAMAGVAAVTKHWSSAGC